MLGNIKLLMQLRFAAIFFQMIAWLVMTFLGLSIHGNILLISLVIQAWVLLMTFVYFKKNHPFSENKIFFQLLFDLLALTVFILSCGGMANPFSGLFLIQALLASLLLSPLKTWIMIAMTGVSYTVLLIQVNPSDEDHMKWMNFHLYGMTINHILTSIVIGFFILKIIKNLRIKEKQIAASQGLLGVGAFSAQIAHKIGTPLNQIAFLIDDLNASSLQKDKEAILESIQEIKGYLSNLFDRLSRIEKEEKKRSLAERMEKFSKWIKTYPISLFYTGSLSFDDETLDVIFVLLELFAENAVQAGAKKIMIDFSNSEQELKVLVQNDGPAIQENITDIMSMGYSKKSGIPHMGIGLFLAHLMTTSLGGQMRFLKQEEVTIELKVPIGYRN